MNRHHLVFDYLVDDIISTYKELIWYCPTKWPNDKPRPHSVFYTLSLSGGHKIGCSLQHLQLVTIKVTTHYGGTFWVRKCILLLVHEPHYVWGKLFFILSSILKHII
jgi:hypothetical protein